jgi:NADPH-dependent curcumin reductase
MHTFVNEVGGYLKSGQLKARETIVDGLDKAGDAFIGLLKGENFGKLVVKIG